MTAALKVGLMVPMNNTTMERELLAWLPAESTCATLRIPLAYVFSLFLLFMVGTIVMYVLRLRQIFRNELEPPQLDAAPGK